MQSTLKKRRGILYDIAHNPVSYLLIVPAALYTLIFGYMTIPYMLTAFQKFNFRTGILGSEFVGLKNFEFFFKSNQAGRIIFNTIRLNLCTIVGTTLVSVLTALLLNELRCEKFKKITQSTFLFPYFLSWIIINYFLYTLTSTQYGVINKLLTALGQQPVSFYTDGRPWFAILVIAKIWKDMGMNIVIYLSAITSMDPQIYEAAMIDGANRWQLCTRVTLRLLLPTICMLTIMAVGKMFYGDFGMIYALVGDNGMLQKTTDVIDTYVFRMLRTTGSPSQAMAVSLFQSVMGFITVFGANYWVSKKFSDGALF